MRPGGASRRTPARLGFGEITRLVEAVAADVHRLDRRQPDRPITTGDKKRDGDACGGSLPEREKGADRDRRRAAREKRSRHRLPPGALPATVENRNCSDGGGSGDDEQDG